MCPNKNKDDIEKILKREAPSRFVYAPNYWQWFTHHKHHGQLPEDLSDCRTQLDMIKKLGLDVFSRNVYCDPTEEWFGGLAEELIDGDSIHFTKEMRDADAHLTRAYRTSKGTLTERRRYVHAESTLVQEEFLLDDYDNQLRAFEELVQKRQWRFKADYFREQEKLVGNDGIVVAGEFYSPLKLLHLTLGPVNSAYLITDRPDYVRAICQTHELTQLDLVRQMAEAGVAAMMAMDNLDSMFHPPYHVEEFSASFYEKASQICHEYGSTFFIHACGRQRANLKLISSLGVDGLEGVAYPPLGDVTLIEAMEMTSDRFIITGGISAAEIENLTSRAEVDEYLGRLLEQMRPYRHRFMLSASCNTPINTTYEQIKWYRDAWEKIL